MKAELSIKKLKSGVQIKVKGEITVQHANEVKQKLTETLPGEGSFLLSLREVSAIDVSAFQLLMALKYSLKANGRQLTISWPESETLQNLLTKTGFKQAILQ
jgi:anti-anti-sigma factor